MGQSSGRAGQYVIIYLFNLSSLNLCLYDGCFVLHFPAVLLD